jgi:diguanylate cyclase (GGDEF)-like protein
MKKIVIWIHSDTDQSEEALSRSLDARGFSLTAADGIDKLHELVHPQDIAALIVDSGALETVSRFRDDLKVTGDGQLPLLVISRESDLRTRLSAMRHGADAFFPPPLDPESIAAKVEELTGAAPDSIPYKVMVVDDDPSQANFAAVILQKTGVEVCTVTESLKVLDTVRSFQPELILMDVYMPDASGLELTTIIREQKDLVSIPIVYLSAEHDPDKQLDALSVGGEDFLTKPIRPKHLVATVRNRIDRSRQLRDRATESHRQEGDPALVRKHILELLEKIHDSPTAAGKATGLLYVEIDSPLPLLEQINLDGIDDLMSSIKTVSKRLVIEEDRVARFGDFCLIVIAQREREQDLLELARQLKTAVDHKLLNAKGAQISTTLSIGIRLLGDNEANVSQLINDAINACHQVRSEGREAIRVHRGRRRTHKIQKAQTAQLEPEQNILDRISDLNNLRLHYQPIVPMQKEQEALYQCLLRLHCADDRILTAGEFLPMVEQTGSILKVDRWVIIKALVKLHKLHQKKDQKLRMMVSQSESTLKDLKRPDWIRESLDKTGVDGHDLVMEFRFPQIATDPHRAQLYIDTLRQMGVGISLNNTNELDTLLHNLDLLPSDYIKITESQIRNYPDTWRELVKRARAKNKYVIVSRIEHPDLLGKLWSHEVDYIQGNFIQHSGAEANYDFVGAVLG